MATTALIALGSNLGDRKANLDLAVASLSATPGVTVRAVSPYHQTTPIGGPDGQGAFLNAAARLETDLDPFELLQALHAVEAKAGRVRAVRWGERPLDVDLLTYGRRRILTPELTVPHPRMTVRRFVLAPLAEIAPDDVEITTGLTVAQLLSNLDRRPSHVVIDAPPGPSRDELVRHVLAEFPSIDLSASKIPPADSSQRQEDQWREFLGEDGWLVSDFHLGCDSVRDKVSLASLYEPPRPGLKNAFPPGRWPIKPTFIVALSGGILDERGPREGTGIPILWPESTEVEGVAREVLAACAATRPG